MQALCPRPDEHPAVRTDLNAIFVSLELSRSTWVITSLAPGSGEKMSKHSVRNGDIDGSPGALVSAQGKARAGRGTSFPSSSSRKQGWTGSGSTGSCKAKGSRAISSIPPPSPRPGGVGGRRPIGSTAKPWFAPCWPTSGASPGFVRWSRLRPRRRRTVAGSVVSART